MIAIEVVFPDGSIGVLGGEDPEPVGYDLRGAFVGSEGMFGIATRNSCVRLLQNYPHVETMLLEFDSVDDAAHLVSDIIADGIIPVALELMDQSCIRVVEAWLGAGLPTDAAAVLLIECAGPPSQVESEVSRIRDLAENRSTLRTNVAKDAEERALFLEGTKVGLRCSCPNKARLLPSRHRRASCEIGGGYRSSILNRRSIFSRRHQRLSCRRWSRTHCSCMIRCEPGVDERVREAGREIVVASIAAVGLRAASTESA